MIIITIIIIKKQKVFLSILNEKTDENTSIFTDKTEEITNTENMETDNHFINITESEMDYEN
jgi:hypothetical protein